MVLFNSFREEKYLARKEIHFFMIRFNVVHLKGGGVISLLPHSPHWSPGSAIQSDVSSGATREAVVEAAVQGSLRPKWCWAGRCVSLVVPGSFSQQFSTLLSLLYVHTWTVCAYVYECMCGWVYMLHVLITRAHLHAPSHHVGIIEKHWRNCQVQHGLWTSLSGREG